jgi:LuxR family maltose regulon positive regulatory protein
VSYRPQDAVPDTGVPEQELPVIPTKIAPPPRPLAPVVGRPRLTARVQDGVDHATLTLLTAPAGTGKSTVVEDWVRAAGDVPIAWVRLDRSDDERRRFWRLVVAALERVGILGPGTPVLPAGRHDADGLLPALVAALDDRTEPAIVVIEDLQEISDPAIFADFERLLRVPPRYLRIVATSRYAPRIRMQRLILAGQVTTIDATDLAFTAGEARALADEVGAAIGDDDLRQLLRCTEGWAAGLALAIRAVDGAADPGAYLAGLVGTEAPLADYLAEEVLRDVPPDVVRFMLETSIADPVSGGLADAITGELGGGATLDDLARRGTLVVAMDERRQWFRYHPLLRGYLAARLRRDAQEDVPVLHRRASAWFAAGGADIEAVRHAILAADWDRVVALVSARWLTAAMDGELAILVRALRRAPERVRMTPHLAVPFAMHALDAGQWSEAEEWLTIARAGRERLSATERLGLAVADLHRYRMVGDRAHAEEAIADGRAIDTQAIEEDGEPGARLPYLAVCAVGKLELGIIELWTDLPEEATEHLNEAVEQARSTGVRFVEHVGLAYLGYLQLFTGDLQAAREYARAADALAVERDWPLTEGAPVVRSVLGHVAFFTGHFDEADEHLSAARRLTARSPDLPLRAYTRLQLGRLRLAQGDAADGLALVDSAERLLHGTAFAEAIAPLAGVLRDRALILLDRADELDEPAGDPAVDAALTVRAARRALAADDPAAADAHVGAWRRAGEPAIHPTMRILALLVQAEARAQASTARDAEAPLADALALAAQTGARLPFLEAGPDVAAALARYPGTGDHAALARDLAAMTAGASPSRPGEHEPTEPSEGLSEKELAVLRFLPTSLTNREIAGELVVSVNTVKTHLKHIYRKLGAHGRRDAVRRARELGLIPPGAGIGPLPPRLGARAPAG